MDTVQVLTDRYFIIKIQIIKLIKYLNELFFIILAILFQTVPGHKTQIFNQIELFPRK